MITAAAEPERKDGRSMKRLLAILAAGLLLPFAGCGKKPTEPQVSEPEYNLVVEDATKPAENAQVQTVTEVVTVTQIVTVTEIVTVTRIVDVPREDAESSYDAGELTETEPLAVDAKIDKDGTYTTKDDVALYIYTYGELPKNFISKKEAQKLGWEGGSLEPYAPGCCIGGSYFGNYEGALPEKEGREYTECDIDTRGKKSRGAKRIVFSNDGLIYYTGDHYKTFELLYGEE